MMAESRRMNAAALIPAYEPDGRLVEFVDALHAHGFRRVVVVDDGSGAAYGDVFAAVEERPFCTVLRHEANRGKGAALKTGIAFLQAEFGGDTVVVTADSDGQHTPEDCRRLAEVAGNGPPALHLGSRSFSFGAVPFKSWLGNLWASLSFCAILGVRLPDTQTGLRAFPVSLGQMLLSVEGERFDYEMGVLVAAVRGGVSLNVVPIRTIYENGNAGTHFRPCADTILVVRLLFAEFFRFAGVSMTSFALDQGLAWAFAHLLAAMRAPDGAVIWFSGFVARFLSSAFNFALNRSFVFRSGEGWLSSAWKYALLCVVVIVLSNAGVSLLSDVGVSRGVSKLICDVLLCFAGYRVQARLVFRR